MAPKKIRFVKNGYFEFPCAFPAFQGDGRPRFSNYFSLFRRKIEP